MTRPGPLAALLAGLLAFVMAGAQGRPPEEDRATGIVAALTQDVVEIQSTFDGAELQLFGAASGLQPGDDIVMTVRGPRTDIRVMRKVRLFGVWVNAAPVRFQDVEGYYAVASTRPLNEFATFSALRRNAIGMDHLRLVAPETQRAQTLFGVSDVIVSELGGEIVDYRQAIVRNRAREGLYLEDPQGVEIIDAGLFRARVILPPVTPVGAYHADVWLFRDGAPIATRRTTLEVRKAGFEQGLYDLAHRHSMIYGLLAVILAVSAGWGAAEVFRRR
jgi:uncharacterized protein (TIGR02186 family)